MIPHNNYSDQELVVLLQRGDHSAFTELYNRYWKKLLLIAWNHTHDKVVSEDLIHELFIFIWTRQYDFEILNVGGFLATKLRFLIFDYHRKEQRRNKIAIENVIYDDFVYGEKKIDAAFLSEFINGIVEELPLKCKLTFKYSREMGMKNKEIAEVMDISEKGVEANLTRALKIIKQNIETACLISPIFLEALLKAKRH